MSYRCDVCGKGAQTGHTKSHSNIKTNRIFKPNLHKVRISQDGTPTRVLVCTRCLRSGKVQAI